MAHIVSPARNVTSGSTALVIASAYSKLSVKTSTSYVRTARRRLPIQCPLSSSSSAKELPLRVKALMLGRMAHSLAQRLARLLSSMAMETGTVRHWSILGHHHHHQDHRPYLPRFQDQRLVLVPRHRHRHINGSLLYTIIHLSLVLLCTMGIISRRRHRECTIHSLCRLVHCLHHLKHIKELLQCLISILHLHRHL